MTQQADLRGILGDQDEASMVQSLMLHLMSEHGVYSAAGQDPRHSEDLHAGLHLSALQNHPITTLFFRPGVAKTALLLNVQRLESSRQSLLAIPAQVQQLAH